MKQSHLRPIFINFAIPMVLSLAGVAISLIVTRARRSGHRERMGSTEEGSSSSGEDQPTDSLCFDASETNASQSDGDEMREADIEELQDGFISLSTVTTVVQRREMRMEERLQKYVAMREREFSLKEARSALELEIAQIEILGLKLESLETEVHRSAECWRIEQQLQAAKFEMRSLKRKMRRLQIANRQSLNVVRRQAVSIHLIESEKEREVQELNDIITELRSIISHLEEQNEELKENLKVTHTLAQSASKNGEAAAVMVSKNKSEFDKDKLEIQLEQLQKDRLSDIEESIYLRWVNACLRYELFRIQEQRKLEHTEKETGPVITEFYQQEKGKICNMGYQREGPLLSMETDGRQTESADDGHVSSSKSVLFQRLKRWVKKKERCRRPPLSDSEENQHTCHGRLSLSDIAIEDVPGRNSY